MKLPTILQVFSYLCVSTLARSLSKPSCIDKCGNVTIPYPFGIGSKCSANPYFTITCQNSTTPFLTSIKLEAINISLLGIVVVKQPVLPVKCSSVLTTRSLPIPSLKRSPFTISAHYNSLVVLGCKNSVWLRANKTSTTGGCTAICDANSTESYCNGVNCCQTTIPPRLKELEYTYKTTEASNSSDNSFCGYVFPADKKWLEKDLRSYSGLLHDMSNPFDLEFGFAPLVLEWELGKLKGYSDGVCTYYDDYCLSHPDDLGRRYVHESEDCERRLRDDFCRLRPSAHECNSSCTDTYYSYSKFYANLNYYSEHSYVSTTKYCSCADGYKGNPYLGFEACIDIDECSINSTSYHPCKDYETCTNMIGHYTCSYDQDYNAESGLKKQQIYGGSMIGTMIMIIIAWSSIKAIKKRINANRRRKFFKRNGGFLLQQQLSATNNGLEKTKLYSFDELTQATNHFNENRILGRGGQGTVYKGMLADGRIVAVKKSKKVEEGDIEVFINEVVILSQVNHRNVVKLSGCCLETEVPLLVYEFIPNGTLFKHIHEPREDFSLTWGMRVRIAREIAGALAYLHSSASVPIYHRDIKSTNILLDEKYRAKISDFGTSRSVAIDQTHLTTRVLGTFGYFDPEYFQSSQFTDKSDVYSFGVVMVELLTGEKAISSVRLELEMSLATHFLHLMEENQLFDIVDARVLKEGKREEVVAMAELARRCLHLNGKRRPTMKEVAVALDGIHVTCEGLSFMQNLDHSIEEVETSHFSSISGSMHLQPLFGEP